MFLKEIELTNFKCHEHLQLGFEDLKDENAVRKTTFILGENGTGKSALLKAIALVTAGSSALADVLGNADDWIQNEKSFCEIGCTISTATGKVRKLILRIERGHGHQFRGIVEDNIETLRHIDNAISKASRNYFVVAYGASRRLSRDEFSRFGSKNKSDSPRSISIQSLFNPDAALIELAKWAMELDYSRKGSGLETVKAALNDFLVENVKFKRIDRQKGTLIFATPDGEVPLEQLSDGYQNVAAWVGDLMFNITNTFRDYKHPLSARGLLLIDEIDLHLHPRWQRFLHSFIKTKLPNFQIVATTHSPLTAQQAEEGELYALKREPGKVALIPFVGDPSKMLIHQILMAPIFGLVTDESLKTEEAKDKVREVRLKSSPSKKEIEQIQPYVDYLENRPMNIRSNTLLSKADVQLLGDINNQLGQHKQTPKKKSLEKKKSRPLGRVSIKKAKRIAAKKQSPPLPKQKKSKGTPAGRSAESSRSTSTKKVSRLKK